MHSRNYSLREKGQGRQTFMAEALRGLAWGRWGVSEKIPQWTGPWLGREWMPAQDSVQSASSKENSLSQDLVWKGSVRQLWGLERSPQYLEH